ncbi:F0F1-type ATP synthase assembly protein I [Clostridium beijerinckii]|uniref:hypothetical protein n=1 Tax=Clostridium beijerinckii TaxID=1520 RepID=UPI001494A74A|nr:hypothetical protein [Clostridium beijerinckii]NOW85867.1 F0F1-type ATP synthase assembly protein I [Clostridium beijerinckii]
MLKNIIKVALGGFAPDKIVASMITKLTFGAAKKIYKSSQENKKRKELEDRVNYFSQRNIIQTIIMYVIGILFCRYLITWGWIGIVLTLLGYYGHFQNLKEVENYVNVNREKILSVISLVTIIIMIF